MEFIFHLSCYNDSALDEETVQLLVQRLEARSRKTMPAMWAATDKLNAYAAKGPGREKRRMRCRVYGAILLVLGIFLLVPGLMEPRTPSQIFVGGAAAVWGIWSLFFRERRSPALPASCRKEAAQLLETRRSIDWTLPENRTELRFDRAGLAIRAGEQTKTVPYSDMTAIYETEHLWLLLYGAEQAMLLQKKDLTAGDPAKFLPYLLEKIPE
ncbi:MAG: YcxB family protein [Oscillospiraceae bacterium]|nr:YcxB family protein [Oscillospiraceae bacterium]